MPGENHRNHKQGLNRASKGAKGIRLSKTEQNATEQQTSSNVRANIRHELVTFNFGRIPDPGFLKRGKAVQKKSG